MPGAAALTGATIQGSVSVSSAPRQASARVANAGGLSVSVVGTNLSASVDSSSRFVLQGVPAGNQQLRFVGSGVDAAVQVADVQIAESIDMNVIVSGSTATIASQSRALGGGPARVQINGTIGSFTGTQSAFQFEIDGRLIKGDAATELFGNTVFADIQNGRDAEVKGVQENGFVYANRLHVEVEDDGDDDGDDQDSSASIEGLLSAKSTGAFPTLTVDGTVVTTDEETVVRRRGDVLDLSVLEVGMTVHVVGVRSASGEIAARMIQIKGDAVGGTFEIKGSMGGLHGACPAIQFGVNGYSVFTDASTAFTPSCASFKSGTKIRVVGTVQSDGRVLATSVEER